MVTLRKLGSTAWSYQGICTDWTPDGIGADIAAVLSVGEVMEVRIFDAGQPRHVTARIVYRNNGNHYGLSFLQPEGSCD